MSFTKLIKYAKIKIPARGRDASGYFVKWNTIKTLVKYSFIIWLFFICGFFSFNKEARADTIFDYTGKAYVSYLQYGQAYFWIPAKDITHIDDIIIKISSTDNAVTHTLSIYSDYNCANLIATSSLTNLSTGNLNTFTARTFNFNIDIDNTIDFLHFVLTVNVGTVNQRVELFNISLFSNLMPFDGYYLIWVWQKTACDYTMRVSSPSYTAPKMKITGLFVVPETCPAYPDCVDFPVLTDNIPDISLDYQKKYIYNETGSTTGYEISTVYSPFRQFLLIVIILGFLLTITFLFLRITKSR